MDSFIISNMKTIASIFLLAFPITLSAQSLFAEANFSDMQYTALVNNISLEESDLGEAWTGWSLFLAKVKIQDVYYGDLKDDETIDIQIYVSYLGRKHTLEKLAGRYILSFCKSEDGLYYTNRDFLVMPDSPENLKELERLSVEGTDFDGNNDCTSTNYDLKPVRID